MGAVANRGVVKFDDEGYEVFKKYKFNGIKLGVGETCQVHEAVDNYSRGIFAVKIIVKDEAKRKGKTDETLHKEAEIMGKLRHPNICQFICRFEDDQLLYFVLELCSGGTLFEKLEQDIVLEEIPAKKICIQMFKAVSHLHGKGFLHRDLRPENWMMSDLSEEAEVKLSNFSTAEYCSKDETLSQPCGTLHYVAPEVLRGLYGRPSDTWTIGVLLFLSLYGSYPFDGTSCSLVMTAIMSSEPDWANSCYALSSDCRDLLKHLLIKDPGKRITLEHALKHPWLPKGWGGGGSRISARKHSLLPGLDFMTGRSSIKNKQIGTASIGISRVGGNFAPKGPELKASAPGMGRRPSALVTSGLLQQIAAETLLKAAEEPLGDANGKGKGKGIGNFLVIRSS